jgi:Ca2+-binding RTX toxin-like protein
MTTETLLHAETLLSTSSTEAVTSQPSTRFPTNWSYRFRISDTNSKRPTYTFEIVYGNDEKHIYAFKGNRSAWDIYAKPGKTITLINNAKVYTPNNEFSHDNDRMAIAARNGGRMQLDAGGGDDFVFVANNGTALFAEMGSGNDLAIGGQLADTIHGETGNDVLIGAGGNDRLFGAKGTDWLDGGSGNDTIYGGRDNDTIIGGAGNDVLSGDLGDDVYIFRFEDFKSGVFDRDTIEGFRSNDRIDLKSFSGHFGSKLQDRISVQKNDEGFAELRFNLDDRRGADLTILVKDMSFDQFNSNLNVYLRF